MKKLFYLFAVAVLAISLASCNKKDEPQPEPTPASDSFTIVVSAIEATSVNLKVTPSNDTAYYMAGIYDASVISEYTAQDIADYLESEVGQYIASGIISFEDLVEYGYIYQGEVGGEVSPLDPETEYAALAFYITSDFKVVGEWNYKTFKTPKLEIVGEETVTLDNCYFYDAVQEQGWYQIIAANADSTFYVSLSPDPVNALTDNVTTANLDAEYSFLALNYQNKYSILEANLKGAVNGNIFTMTGYFVASNAIKYNVTFSADMTQQDEGGDAAAAPKKKSAPKKAIVRKAIKK